MKLRNGTLVDGILDVNPTATLFIAKHNASTPLLKLPLEVKNLIYKYALGGRLIHITQDYGEEGAKFKSTVCCALLSEEEAQDNFDNENTNHWNAPANEGRHDCCRVSRRAARAGPTTEIVNLGLLRACRQVYNEAHFIPYSTNTFSCTGPKTLQSFVLLIAQGTKSNHLAIRSLFLDMVYDDLDHRGLWTKAISTCVSKFKALQKIGISIEKSYFNPTYGDLASDGKRRKDTLVSTIRGLKRLPLRTATMVISDDRTEQFCILYGLIDLWNPHRYSLDQKRKWVRDLREYILQSNR